MSLSNQFDSNTNQAVNDALATKSEAQGQRTGLPASLNTAEGGDLVSNSSFPPESYGLGYIGEHGTLATSYNIERTIQGEQSLESLTASEKDARVGGTGPYINSNGVGNENVTGTSAAYTMYDNQRQNTVYVPNVGNRFSR